MVWHLIHCLIKAAFKTIEHDGVEHAGYMAFMVLLSIFPFIVFFLASTSFVGASELGKWGIIILFDNLPPNILDTIIPRVNEMLKSPPQSLLTLAVLGTIWTSSSFVEGLRTILNRVHQVSFPPPYWFRRILSITQFIIISVVIFLTILLLVFIPIVLGKIPRIVEFIDSFGIACFLLRYLLIAVMLFLAISAIYYFIPNTKLKFKEVAPGAIVTAVLWLLSGTLLSKYIKFYNQLNIIYGSLGSIIITLLFFYIIAMIFIYGAEFNHQLLMNNRQ